MPARRWRKRRAWSACAVVIGSMHVAITAGELRITLSAGLAEHHAGETVEQTLDRAERALSEAKQQGRDRLIAAP